MDTIFLDDFSREVWETTYKHKDDESINDTLKRVAKAVASVEITTEKKREWEEKFYQLLTLFRVTTGGRIMANAGTNWRGVTLINCVSGTTRIWTRDGLKFAADLNNKTIEVLTQDGIFSTVVWKSFGNQKLFKIELENSDILYATEGHEWVVTKPSGGKEKVNTKSLLHRRIPLNGINKYQYKDDNEYRTGIRHGLTFGDGNLYTDFKTGKKYTVVNQFGDSRHIIVDYFDTFWTTYYCGDKEGIYYVKGLPPEYKVFPRWENYSMDYLRGFLAGYIAADGCVDSRGHVMLHCAHREVLEDIRSLAAHVGIPTVSIRLVREESPFDGSRCPLWKLTFVKKYFQKDDRLIIKNSHKEKINNSPCSNSVTTIEVVSITETDKNEEVFCCEEPTSHTFTIESGYVTGNCFVGPKPKYDQDSIEGIFDVLTSQVLTLKSEGGWGMNFSFIRPRGSFIYGIGVETPGSVKYMELFNTSSDVITAGSGKKKDKKEIKGKIKIRKGAMMGILDCVSGDTEISTLNGKVPIKNLVGQTPLVYCTDGKGHVYVRKANKVWSKGIRPVVRIKFDDDTYLKCTDEHLIMLSDGSYKPAKDLNFGDSIPAWNKGLTGETYRNHYPSGFSNHKVVSIELYGEEEVYDMSVPEFHNFVANGVFVHNCWHPDIEEFITAKLQEGRLNKFNLSVNCSNEFMDRVVRIHDIDCLLSLSLVSSSEHNVQTLQEEKEKLEQWDLIFPDTKHPKYKEEWDGNMKAWKEKGYEYKVYKTVRVTDLWNLIMESTYNRNDPGVLFLDRANETHCFSYGGSKTHIAATNPCLAKDTLVNTPTGYVKIQNVSVGDNISTMHPCGYEPVKSIEKHDNTPVFRVKFSDGGEQLATAAHRYHVQRKNSGSKFIEKLRLDEIEIGDFVQVSPTKFKWDRWDKNVNPMGHTDEWSQNDYEIGMMLGILLGDGSCGINMKIATSQKDKDFNSQVKSLFQKHGYFFNQDDLAKDGSLSMNMPFTFDSSYRLYQAFQFPNAFDSCNKSIYYGQGMSHSLCYLVGIINGLLATDGNINLKSNHPQIRFDTCSKTMALDIRRVLLLLGVHGRISESFSDGGIINGRTIERQFPKYTVSVSGFDFKTLGELCYQNINPDKQAKIKTALFNSKLSGNSRSAEVLSIEPEGQATVYDLHCEESDTWITDGYVQQGCGEQCLPFGFVCNLGSINLTQFVDQFGKFQFDELGVYVPWAVRLLDNVNDLTNAPLPEYERNIKEVRRIGLGVMGWGSMLYMMRIRFGSDKAEELKDKIMSTITSLAVRASVELAKEKGMFTGCNPKIHAASPFFKQIGISSRILEDMEQYGIRNSALFSNQPTGNTGVVANIVTGGIEPLFMAEYIRTVIVDGCPADMLSFTPKYWEGEFKETNVFKFVQEGGEKILRGTYNGIIYKIDKNRGLTKEVPCIDYGVRYLRAREIWDPKADWAVTASTLSVQEHLRDMTGFAKWVDSSISKTVNLPNDYPYDSFKNLYLDAYKSGVLKGITTYRAGTMMNVLAANKFVVPRTTPPKRPVEVKGELHHFVIDGRKYYTAVGMDEDGKVSEVFTGVNQTRGEIFIPKTVRTGIIKKECRGHYTFIGDDKEKYELTNGHSNDEADALTRMISGGLRHGMDIGFAVHQLEKTEGPLVCFSKVLARTLKKYIKDGTYVCGEECPECKNKMIRKEGCVTCPQCGYSKC